jgi:8-oxo-dGTP diphosphatase
VTETAVAIALILERGRCFAQRRDPGAARFPGLWEFPGGKLEVQESPLGALGRELMEELRWTPEAARALPVLRHAYPGLAVALHPFLCRGEGRPETGLAWGWFTAGQLAALPMPGANAALLEQFSGLLR